MQRNNGDMIILSSTHVRFESSATVEPRQCISNIYMYLYVSDQSVFIGSEVSHAFGSVHCCLLVTCWERAGLLALVGDVYCIFVTFPCGILGQVWYLIKSFPDFYRPSYFSSH